MQDPDQLIQIVNAKLLLKKGISPRDWKDFISPDGRLVYVGRPSRLGNPFSVEQYGRDQAIHLYGGWLSSNQKSLDWLFRRLLTHYQHGKFERPMGLVCWCAPLACHAEFIRTHLLNMDGADDPDDLDMYDPAEQFEPPF